MRKQWISFCLSSAISIFVAGCADTATCDPNEMLYAGRCMPIPMQEPAEASVDEAAVESEAAESAAPDNTVDAGPGDASDEH